MNIIELGTLLCEIILVGYVIYDHPDTPTAKAR